MPETSVKRENSTSTSVNAHRNVSTDGRVRIAPAAVGVCLDGANHT